MIGGGRQRTSQLSFNESDLAKGSSLFFLLYSLQPSSGFELRAALFPAELLQALLQHLLQRLQRGGERGVPSGAAAAQVALADELARLGRVGALVVQLLLGGVGLGLGKG